MDASLIKWRIRSKESQRSYWNVCEEKGNIVFMVIGF
jgi:hypothetical protein